MHGWGHWGCAALAGWVGILAVCGVVRADDPTWQVGTAPTFSTGTYGTDTRTNIVYVPATVRRLFENGDVTLVAPFLCISGNGSVTNLGGIPIRKEQSGNSGSSSTTSSSSGSGSSSSSGGSGRGRGSDDLSPGTGALPGTVTTCGVGDLVLRGRYYVLDEHDWMPTVAIRGHVKIPTADADRGLGTGRFDEGVGVELTKTLRPGWMALLDGGYTFIGNPSGVDFNNQWWYDIGLGHDVTKAMNLSVFYEEYRSIVPGLPNPRDLLVSLSIKGEQGWRYQVSPLVGLSSGAPDFALTVGVSRRF